LVRLAGVVFVAYFVLSVTAVALRSVPLQVIATAFYFVLAVFLYRVFAPANPTLALALLPLALAGCVIQGVGQAQADAGLLRAALVPFGVFLVVLGYLVLRAELVPLPLGVILLVAGFAWPVTAAPGIPTWYAAVAALLGIVAEGGLAVWLVTRPG
jgi:hypothetical protein